MSTSNFQLLRKLCLAARSLSTPKGGLTSSGNDRDGHDDKAVSTVELESNPKALRVEPGIASLEVAGPFG